MKKNRIFATSNGRKTIHIQIKFLKVSKNQLIFYVRYF